MTACPELPNLRHLRMVQMIGRLNGVSAAARQLNTSQPAVTQAVTNVEAMFGAPLFDRRATGTFPNEVGQAFLRRIDRVFEILDAAIAAVTAPGEAETLQPLPQAERLVTSTQLRSLVVAADAASLGPALEQLQVSSASLFRSARSLEKTLGRRLFDRTASGPQCNRTGLDLARQVRMAAREIEFGKAEVARILGDDTLQIVVGMLPMAGTYELAGAVRHFARARPSAKVTVRTGTYSGLLDDLANCRVDMIFGVLRKPGWDDTIEEETLFTDSYCIVCRPGHPLTRQSQANAAALARFDWIVPVKGTPRRSSFETIFAGTDLEPRCNIEVNSHNCARAMMLESDMITVMARSEVHLDESLGTLATVSCPQLDRLTQKGVTTRAGWLPTDGHTQFLDCLRQVTSRAHYDRPVTKPVVALVS